MMENHQVLRLRDHHFDKVTVEPVLSPNSFGLGILKDPLSLY